tara:strand:- start:183 stop:650 length:468 start_codon:yes stop_codon:yes gene_type:complete
MAATSTNKQPLLVDNVLHYALSLDTATNDGLDIAGTNTAVLLVDGTSSDGAIIEDIYTISRGTTGYKVNLYLSSANDYLRPNQAVIIGGFTSGTTAGDIVRWEEMPKSLAPVPQVGTESFNRALYIPKGKTLWAARNSTANVTDAPIVACQGGWY